MEREKCGNKMLSTKDILGIADLRLNLRIIFHNSFGKGRTDKRLIYDEIIIK